MNDEPKGTHVSIVNRRLTLIETDNRLTTLKTNDSSITLYKSVERHVREVLKDTQHYNDVIHFGNSFFFLFQFL